MTVLLRQAYYTYKLFGSREFFDRLLQYAALVVIGVKAYQKPLVRAIRKMSDEYEVYIDVGAARGDIVEAVEKDFKYTVAVEPAPHHIKILRQKKDKNKLTKASIVEAAAGSKNGVEKLGLSDSNKDDNSLFDRDDIQNYVKVRVVTLDSLCSELKLPKKVFVKIDVQGFEGSVLAGSKQLMRNGSAFCFEFWPWGLNRCSGDPLNLIHLLQDEQYSIVDLKMHPIPFSRIKRIAEAGVDNKAVVMDLIAIKQPQRKKKR